MNPGWPYPQSTLEMEGQIMAKRKSKRSKKQAKLIPAYGYLRKSRKGKGQNGREKQEKSIPQQKREITKLAKEYGYEITGTDWFIDEGVKGWIPTDDKPEFSRMLTATREQRIAKAVLCDDIDRFSRAGVTPEGMHNCTR